MAAAVNLSAPADPHLGAGPDEESSEVSLSGNGSDSGSLLSDDSVLPVYEREERRGAPPFTLYGACAQNQPHALRKVLEKGVSREEVLETDINGWNGLMIACYKGYVDIVHSLHTCPYIDINQQDNEGNTALMIAAQAGHINTVNYLLNYYPGADTEIRDYRGFTALIKAAMQGRENVVAALIMAGADINAVDATKGRCARDWALKTGRFETLQHIRRLNRRPVAEQFCESYVCEWPELRVQVAKTIASQQSAGAKLTQRLKSTFGFSFPRDPQENGVLDHMVRMTTGFHSPLVVTACRPLCPTSPPEVGKRRLAVPELALKHSGSELVDLGAVCHRKDLTCSLPAVHSADAITNSCCVDTERRGSVLSLASVRNFVPRGMTSRRNSVFPSGCIPQINIVRSGEPTPKKEKKKKKEKEHRGYLELPKWRYKEIKDEKKKAKLKEEEEKKAEEKAERKRRKKEMKKSKK